MAVFNPQISPTNDPNYLNYSKVVEAAPPDMSKAMSLKVLGEGVAGVTKVADDFMQMYTKQKATEGVDAIRDIQTQVLEQATTVQPVVPQPAQTADGRKVTEPSLLDSNASMDVPAGIRNGLNRAGTLAEATAASGGKINDTSYTAQLNALAKNLRAQYPGYRPYIDEQISQMTGINPANAYVKNMMEDLNNARTSGEKRFNETLSDLRKSSGASTDGIASNEMVKYFEQTRDFDSANKWLYKVNKDEWAAKQKTLSVTSNTQDEATVKSEAESGAVQLIGNAYNNHMYAATVTGSMDTSAKIAEKITMEGKRPGSFSAQEMEASGRYMIAARNELEAKIRYDLNKPMMITDKNGQQTPAVDRNGRKMTYASINGSSKTEEMITNGLKGYDTVITAALDGKKGTATYAATHAQRVREDLDNGIISDPDNKALVKLDWMSKNMGPVMQNQILTQALIADVDQTYRNLLTDKTKDIFVPQSYKNGIISTFKQDVVDAKTGKNTSGVPIEEKTKFYDGLVGNIRMLANPEARDEDKMSVANYYFRPEGRGILQEFKQGYWVDPSGKPLSNNLWNNVYPGKEARWIPGREAVWDKLTNKQVTDNIAKLGKLPGGQQTVKNYVDWAESEFSSALFVPEIQNLNRFQDQAVNSKNPIHLKWNSDTNQFQFIDKNEKVITPKTPGFVVPGGSVDENFLNKAQPSLDRLNSGLKNMSNIQDSIGNKQGTSAYLINLLERAGHRPNENLGGMSQKFYDAVRNSHKSTGKRIEDVFSGLGNNE